MDENCSECSGAGEAVRINLVRHHVRAPWSHDLESRQFSFCATVSCDVVYFSEDGLAFRSADLRHPPAYKTGDSADLLCFCFDVSGEAAMGTPGPLSYIRERVRKGECACEVLNPCGACCLGTIGQWQKDRARER